MAAHKGPASLRPRCTRSCSSVAVIPVCRSTISNESVCQVTRSWVDVGCFHTRLLIIFMNCYSVSPEYFVYTVVFRRKAA
jgi:hypothetical protein